VAAHYILEDYAGIHPSSERWYLLFRYTVSWQGRQLATNAHWRWGYMDLPNSQKVKSLAVDECRGERDVAKSKSSALHSALSHPLS